MSAHFEWEEDDVRLHKARQALHHQYRLIRRTLMTAVIILVPVFAWWTWHWPARGEPHSFRFTLLQSGGLAGFLLLLAASTYLPRLRAPREAKRVELAIQGVTVDDQTWPWEQIASHAIIDHDDGTSLRLIVGTWRDRRVIQIYLPTGLDNAALISFIGGRSGRAVKRIDMRQFLKVDPNDAKWIAILSSAYYLCIAGGIVVRSSMAEPISLLLLAYMNPAWLYALLAEPRTSPRIAARGVVVICACALGWFALFGWLAAQVLWR